jgi:hypothetical protein
MNANDLTLVSFIKVVNEVLNRVFGFFEKKKLGQFVEQGPEFIVFDVFLRLNFLLDCLLFVHGNDMMKIRDFAYRKRIQRIS